MKITIVKSCAEIDWSRVCEMFQLVNWGCRKPLDIQQAFERGSFVRFLYCDNQLAGFGRTVDDGQYYAMITDLVVAPEFQGFGIGQRILSELKDDLEGYIFTTLTAAVGMDEFYVKQGWGRQKSAFIWPRSDEQKKHHVKIT